MKRLKIQPIEKPITATVAIPGSKSYTNRALLLAALRGGSVKLKNPLVSDDTHAMIACLRALGIKCVFKGDLSEGARAETGTLVVSGDIKKIKEGDYSLNANLSGTTIRFLLAFACIIPGTKTIRGRGRLNERPIAHLVESLRELGAKIEYVDKKGYPPVRVLSSNLKAGKVKMKDTISSQFLSALLMVAQLVGRMEIEVEGDQISRPYVTMTIEAMSDFGVKVENKDFRRYVVASGQKYTAKQYTVEGDVSSASYFFAIAALTRSTITLTNMNPRSSQADMRFLKILEEMGSVVSYGKDSITVEGGGVKPVTVDMENCPDQAQTLAVLAAFADGKTTMTGIRSLRVKETERVVAVEQELKKMGIKTESTQDSMTIYGGSPRPARIDTYGDHRMAMAFAVAATKLPGMEISDPDVVTKTFPRFWKALALAGAPFEMVYEHPNIVLIGMRGGGKSTIARLLSERLGKKLADLDATVEKEEGISITDMVEKFGWEYFRDRESEAVKKVTRQKDVIVSTGGGVINRPENIAALKQRGILIFLSSSAKTLARRIDKDEGRPRLTEAATTLAEVEAVLAERKKLYEAAADEIINDEGLTLEGKVAEVLKRLERRHIL